MAEGEKQAPVCYHDALRFLSYGDPQLFSILLLILLMQHPDPSTKKVNLAQKKVNAYYTGSYILFAELFFFFFFT